MFFSFFKLLVRKDCDSPGNQADGKKNGESSPVALITDEKTPRKLTHRKDTAQIITGFKSICPASADYLHWIFIDYQYNFC